MMENNSPVIIESDANSFVFFCSVFYCFDFLIDLPDSRAWSFVVELDEFSAARFGILLHRIEKLVDEDVALDEMDAIITLAVFHFISLCFFDDEEEEIIKTQCEDWVHYSLFEQRPYFLRYSTNLIAMLKEHCMSQPGFAAVVKYLES